MRYAFSLASTARHLLEWLEQRGARVLTPPLKVDAIAKALRPPSGDRRVVAALERELRVQHAFESARESFSKGDLARRATPAKPTISRSTHTLSRHGSLSRDPVTGHYRPRAGALSLEHASLSRLDVCQVARPLMQSLVGHNPASVPLCAIDGRTTIHHKMRRSPPALGLGPDIGDRVPLSTTGVGLAYLAALEQDERQLRPGEIRRSGLRASPKIRRGIEQAISDVRAARFSGFARRLAPRSPVRRRALSIRKAYGTLAFGFGGFASSLPARASERGLGPRLAATTHQVETMPQPGPAIRRGPGVTTKAYVNSRVVGA